MLESIDLSSHALVGWAALAALTGGVLLFLSVFLRGDDGRASREIHTGATLLLGAAFVANLIVVFPFMGAALHLQTAGNHLADGLWFGPLCFAVALVLTAIFAVCGYAVICELLGLFVKRTTEEQEARPSK